MTTFLIIIAAFILIGGMFYFMRSSDNSSKPYEPPSNITYSGSTPKSKSEELEMLNKKQIDIGIEAVISSEMSINEKQNILNQINDMYDNDDRDPSWQIYLGAIGKLLEKYPSYSDRIELLRSRLFLMSKADILFEFQSIINETFFEFELSAEYAEQIQREYRAEGKFIDENLYRQIKNAIGRKYEAELIAELDTVKPEDIEAWIEMKKDDGISISKKAWAKAMAVKEGREWKSNDEYFKNR